MNKAISFLLNSLEELHTHTNYRCEKPICMTNPNPLVRQKDVTQRQSQLADITAHREIDSQCVLAPLPVCVIG